MAKKVNNNGQIGVQSENIFPIIKKFLYSDHDIFLRELVSNAVDATQKLKTLAAKGEVKGELGDLSVRVAIKDNQLIISDSGVGMTAEEIEKYINQIAISGAEEFLDKYKDDAASIIGHFGLGFYSSFMVASRVEIVTQSYQKEAPTIRWSCDGTPAYTMQEEPTARERGTDIILHIDDENKEFLDEARILSLLEKYCKFLPVPIIFGKKQEWKDGKYQDTNEDRVVNNTNPAWTRTPQELKEEDYLAFYRELYPMSEAPLFWIHLNIDYPFNLTGILYFPRIRPNMELSRNKIQLYSNQVFVTDSVEGIVPDYLTILHGVLDSPDIPLNVSRSYLQSDANVKKISAYITRKVADRLEQLYKEDRKTYEEKWSALELFVKYGMLTDSKFDERAEKFLLLRNSEGKLFTLAEYRELCATNQTNKDDKVVYLYTTAPQKQYSYVAAAKNKGYDVLVMEGQLDLPYLSHFEQKHTDAQFVRVDSNTLDNLIEKKDNEKPQNNLSEEDANQIVAIFREALPELPKAQISVTPTHQGPDQKPLLIVQNEVMRRMKDMSAFNPQMSFLGEQPDFYEIALNLDNPLVQQLLDTFKKEEHKELDAVIADKKGFDARLSSLYQKNTEKELTDDEKKSIQEDIQQTTEKVSELDKQIKLAYRDFGTRHLVISQLIDLALLSNGMLSGESLDKFVNRSLELINTK